MVSGADVRQALQAGLWEALEDGDDRAAMRATCRDARDMADELHDSAVLPVGPGTWGSAAAIAAYHRRLGAVRSLHVRYSCGEVDEAHAAQFVEAYSAALGAALPVEGCTIGMTLERQLGASFAAALLARVVPRVERLDVALGSYGNLAQLLTLLGPCTHLRSLRLLPAVDDTRDPDDVCVWLDDRSGERVLEALCGLSRLHTLSGPWMILECSALRRLCAALPSLTTLGFQYLSLVDTAGACISRQLRTLAGWRCDGCGNARCPSNGHLLDSAASDIYGVCNLQSLLPAVQQLDSVVLDLSYDSNGEDVLAEAAAIVQRYATYAERWACRVAIRCDEELEAVQGLAQGSLAFMRHMVVEWYLLQPAPAFLRSLVAAAPNITTLALHFVLRGHSTEALADMLGPLCRAARLRTLRLAVTDTAVPVPADRPTLWLAEAVRGLVRPNAEGECCSALRHVLLAGAQPGALHACRRALADDGVDVSLDACAW